MGKELLLKEIDTSFDFTSDCKIWEDFWKYSDLLGHSKYDPDAVSKRLKQYHQVLWSRQLPNGEKFILKPGGPYDYLNAQNGMRLSSDTIVTTFMHGRMVPILEEATKCVDWKSWIEATLRQMYTIGGTILFPKHVKSINGQRGMNPFICDRWDLTLECIRRYYSGIIDAERNPIGWVLESDKDFFDLFMNFQGYCEFFFLQDCVTEDFDSVRMWLPTTPFTKRYPYPDSVEEYFHWIEECLSFVKKRNQRIEEYVSS